MLLRHSRSLSVVGLSNVVSGGLALQSGGFCVGSGLLMVFLQEDLEAVDLFN